MSFHIVIITFLISTFLTSCANSQQGDIELKKADSSLMNAWNQLGEKFLYRIKVFENLASKIATPGSIDSSHLDSLKMLELILIEKLNQKKPLDSIFIDEIRNLNKRVIGFFPIRIFPIKNDASSISTEEFRDIQTSLEGMEHRIFMAQKEYNEICNKINRKDLIYKTR